MQQHGEPSVEEILESIKKVIARDNREIVQADRKRRVGEGTVTTEDRKRFARFAGFERSVADEAGDGDVLDLNLAEAAVVDDAADAPTPEDMPDPGTAGDDPDGDRTESAHGPDLGERNEGTPAAKDRHHGEDDTQEPPLTDARVAMNVRQSLEALSIFAETGDRSAHGDRDTDTALEGIVRDMLRPMLSEWLDDHLPEIVERMVQAEFARIAGKRR